MQNRFAAQNADERRAVDDYPLYSLITGVERKGHEYQALCPFHADHSLGSFTMYQQNGAWRYKCFACGEAGNAANMVMKLERLTYPQALHRLGIRRLPPGKAAPPPLPKPEATAIEPTPAKEVLPPLDRDVWRSAFHTLFDNRHIADELMKQRGFTDVMTLIRFQFGWLRHAPMHEGAGAGDAWVIPLWPPGVDDPIYCMTRNRTRDVDHRRRYMPLMTPKQASRYTQPKQLFWAADPDMPTDKLYIVEGELKAATMWDLGLPAIGVPGVGSVNLLGEPARAGLLDSYGTIVVMFDDDEAGRAAAGKVPGVINRKVKNGVLL